MTPQATHVELAMSDIFQNTPINFETSVILKIWEQGTESLPTSHEVNSNMSAAFIKILKVRAITMGCQTNVLINLVAQCEQAPAISHLLINQYDLTSMEDFTAHALTYFIANIRDAHNDMMCYNCILMSFSEHGWKKITSELQSYPCG